MTPSLQELGINRLGFDERLALAEAIWESIVDEIERTPIPQSQLDELDRRIADSVAHPNEGTPWEIIKARALARARK
jgi:putative addiction module component (TIGR02574 family)